MESLSFNLALPKTLPLRVTCSPVSQLRSLNPNAKSIGSPSSFRRKNSDTSTKKSNFSKRSTHSNDNNDFEDHNFGEACRKMNLDSYLHKLNTDFEQRKVYEDIVLKILNEYSRS